SEGAEVDFPLAAQKDRAIRVFTTRPDTLFGATYMVLSPEHPWVESITTPGQKAAVQKYQEEAARKSEMERTELAKTKSGVFTGAYAINPVNNEQVPIWIADYVLATYGTGAIMAVPAHDERDFEFAQQFKLPIKTVVRPTEEWLKKTKSTLDRLTEAYVEEGNAVNSGAFDGMTTVDFKKKITQQLESQGKGQGKINYKLRDWLFSRQRYWGEPFPILHELGADGKPNGLVRALTEKDLPLQLPEMEDFKPSGKPEPPLGKATDWINVTLDGKKYVRETNTMPQWAGSCWYYIRYLDSRNDKSFCDPHKAKYWLPVDLYVGGAEHAVLHLLYSRFWHKVLFDRGHVPTAEPFQKLVNQGMILGMVYYRHKDDATGQIVSLQNLQRDKKYTQERVLDEDVEEREDGPYQKGTDVKLLAVAEKMSKARGNVINPDDVVAQYGADSLRLYEMFMGPLEAVKPWSMRGVEGVFRFLNRVWRLIIDDRAEAMTLPANVQDVPPSKETLRKLHQTIQKVTEDLDAMRFNTAISAMMELSNHLTREEVRSKSVLDTFVLLLSPFAPHLAEELWSILGHRDTLAYEPWPSYDPALTKADEIEVPVQVNGKLRSKVTVPAGINEATLREAALADERIRELIAGKQVRKVIVVPGKMVNIVVA
ncbi:MAG TPA: leucine--tRNA ligase, partial [Gemmataceae bacterium]|nr:leucine--tRNA ligase [Gemmataceae bacterium]